MCLYVKQPYKKGPALACAFITVAPKVNYYNIMCYFTGIKYQLQIGAGTTCTFPMIA